MRSGDVDSAVSSGVSAMLTTISPTYAGASAPPEYSGSSEQPGAGATFVVIVLGVSILFALFFVILEVTREMRYGYLVLREGRAAARKDMKRWPAWGWALYGGAGSSFGSGGFGGGFSAGGGGFGGGGASGGW